MHFAKVIPVLLQVTLAWKPNFEGAKKPDPATVVLRKFGDQAYVGHIKYGDSHFNLHLKRAEVPALSNNFKLLTSTDNSGHFRFKDISPTPQERYEIDSKIFVDSNAGGAFLVHDLGKRNIQLQGILNGVHIGHDGEGHLAYTPKQVQKTANTFGNGIVPAVPDMTQTKKRSVLTKIRAGGITKVTFAYPEVLLVIDHQQWRNLGQNVTNVLHYLSVLIHAVNIQYSTSGDPVIKFQLVGTYHPPTLSAQPFLEQSKVDDGSEDYDLLRTLTNFNDWLYEHKSEFPAFDIASLISGVLFKDKGRSVDEESNTAGIAYTWGACSWDYGLKWEGNIVVDQGAYWSAAYDLGHEFAHNLGVPHDGEEESSSCPFSDGYIMSYDGWGNRNKFHFSSCSREAMKEFINSKEGQCVRKQSSSVVNVSSAHAGELLSMKEQCIKYLGRRDVDVDWSKTPHELCKKLRCVLRPACTVKVGCNEPVSVSRYPGDKTPCDDNGGTCWHGSCVRDRKGSQGSLDTTAKASELSLLEKISNLPKAFLALMG